MCELQRKPDVVRHLLKGDGRIPNNPKLPLLIYPNVVSGEGEGVAAVFERTVSENSWYASWRWGVYDFHHFHSNTHEALGCFRGTAVVLFGGEKGVRVDLTPGDFVVIPAGVGHKLIESTSGFSVVGCYPQGQQHDMRYGEESEYESARSRVEAVPLPAADPLFGETGPLVDFWEL